MWRNQQKSEEESLIVGPVSTVKWHKMNEEERQRVKSLLREVLG